MQCLQGEIQGENMEVCNSRYLKNAHILVQLKMSVKKFSSMKEIFDKSHDVVLKLNENQKQTSCGL